MKDNLIAKLLLQINAIKLNPRCANSFYNLAGLFIIKGNLLKGEIYLRKAIDFNSNFASAHYNLGFILKNLGKLQEAKLHFQKAININPNLTEAYLSLSTIKDTEKDSNWENQLFTKGFLNNKEAPNPKNEKV